MKDRIKTLSIWLVTSFGTIVGWAIGQGILYYARNTEARVTMDDLFTFWVLAPFGAGLVSYLMIKNYVKTLK